MRCPQLSLFDTEPASVEVAPAPDAPDRPPLPAANASEVVTATAPFAHPLADSRIELNGHTVAYALRRARRRSIGLLVGLDGLRVSAPRWATRRDIETALNERADWIVRKLGEQVERAHEMRTAEIAWRDGARLPYVGTTLWVRLGESTTTQCALDNDPPTLQLGLPATAGPAEVQAAAGAWLKRQALALFEQRLAHFAPLLKVQHSRLHLSSAQTRWGSAHASGAIRLNWRLIHFELPVIDYVVAHELAHLREMNHSARFWDLVASVVPDVRAAQQVLKDTVLPAWR